MATLATQNKFYVFVATRQTSKIPVLEGLTSPPIAQAAVIGLGTMGTGILKALTMAGVRVLPYDENPTAYQRGWDSTRTFLAEQVSKGKLPAQIAEDILQKVPFVNDWERLRDVDLVIESVFEDVAVKRSAIRRVEEICPAQAIIASNTSTISLDVLAEGMRHPERLLGLHFFNPAHRMPLVEVIHRTSTPPELTAALLRFARKIGKTPILVKNREGFLVNRLFVPYLKEAFWLLEEGAEPFSIDQAMVDFGFAMGPFVLIDMAGLDILVLTDSVLRQAFPHHGGPAASAVRLVQQGHLGQKTGSGVYRYEKARHTPWPSPETAQIIAEVRQERGLRPRQISAADITQRLVLRMVNEAFRVLEEGLCPRPSDLDVAMVLGTGLADFRGGVVKYAQDVGLIKVREQLQQLAAECGERYAPSFVPEGRLRIAQDFSPG